MGVLVKMRLNFIYLFVFILLTSLSAFDFNTTIIHGTPETYSKILQKLSTDKNNSDEINLQKTLLQKLIELKYNQVEQNLTIPTNQKNYIALFDIYLEDAIQYEKVKTTLQNNINKISTLKAETKEHNTTSPTKQLFYALYQKKERQQEKKLSYLKQETSHIQMLLIKSLKQISFNQKSIDLEEQKLSQKEKNLENTIQQLHLKRERYILMEKNYLVSTIEKKFSLLKLKKEQLTKKKIHILFLYFSIALQKNNNQAFLLHKNILSQLSDTFSNKETIVYKMLDTLLTSMEKKVLGTVEAIKEKGMQEFKTQLENIWEIINNPLFHINQTPVSIFKLAISLLIFIVGFMIGNLYKKYIKRLSQKNRAMTSGTRTLLSNIGYYIIFLITFFIVLKVLGIDLSSIALVAGALSVGIGFGLQNIISNFVSGIILMVERSVKIGDYIELDDKLRGHVVDIKMRSITVNTNSNIDVIVPNQDLIQNRVVNWTMNDKIRRFEIPFGVAYGTDPKKVIDVISQAIEKSKFNDIYNTQDKYTRIIMTGMGDSSVDFELFVWIIGREILYPKRTTSRFLILIYDTLYANNIEIPFPQQDIHIKSIDTTFPISSSKETS